MTTYNVPTIYCAVCHEPLEIDDRVVFNKRETFIFKPANVDDVKIYQPDGKGGVREVNAAAVLSPDALAETRKDYKKTELATVYARFGKEPLPEGAINVRHAQCGVHRTGAALTGAHPLSKHSIRFSRGIKRGGGHY